MNKEDFSSLIVSPHFHSEIYQSERFIHRCIVFVVYEKLHENSYQTNLVTRILSRGTKQFLRSFELSRFLYSLYGTYLDASVTKWGSHLVYTLTIKNLIPENWSDPLRDSTDLALEMILGATWDKRLFFESYFNEEKSNQITEIKDLVNDKYRYAFERFIQWMFEKEPFGISILGNEQNINKIDNSHLSKFYAQNFLCQNRMVFFLDNKMSPLYKDIITQFSDFTGKNEIHSSELPFLGDFSGKVRRKTDIDQIQQSWIFMGCRFKKKLPEIMYPAMLLFNNIFGGQSNSILFRKVREEKGLCYFISSSLPAGVDSIIITAGIARKNQKMFEKVVMEEILKIEKTNVTDIQLQTAKDLTITSLYSILDHPYQLISMKIESILFNRIQSLQDLIKQIQQVSIEDIGNVAKELFLECVYMLQGTE
jgi:predicted Zn-dependent peptidase